MTNFNSIKSDPNYQYAYGRSPLYCSIDRATTEITDCGFWLILDDCLDAPECVPIGCTHGRDQHGPRAYKNFVPRVWSLDEERCRNELAEQLISELLAELS